MQKVKSFIGKKLLDMLMFSMYPDAKIIYREYVQNAFDSINKAVSEGVLSKVKDGIVSIKIDNLGRNIHIKDNGAGLGVDYALNVLTSIADSQKDGIEQAGVYGIGRLVGAGYCKVLEFRTSAKGEASASVIKFDVDKTRTILDNDNDRRSATEVIDSIVDFDIIDEEADAHYFEVILHNVEDEYPILLSEVDIIEYLKEVAPIDYEMPFKNNIMYDSIEADSEFDKLQNGLKYIKLSVNGYPDIRKRYGNRILGTNDEIHGLQYFKLEDQIYGLLAWGWFAITKFTKAIPSSDPNRGIRLRKHNIQVGEGNYLNEFFDETRGNNYFYGEIHAVHENLKPNTSRAGLTPTVEATVLFKKLNEYFKQLKFIYNLANKAKTAARDITAAKAKIQKGNLSESEQKDVQATLASGQKKLESATRSVESQSVSQNAEATQKILALYQQEIEKAGSATSVAEPLSTTTKTIETISTSTSQTETQETQQKQGKDTSIQPGTDIFQPWANKYDKKAIWLARRIFKSLSDNCPQGSLNLIEDLKMLVIKELS